MEKQSLNKGAQPALGLFGILREAFRASIRNGRILLLVTLVMFAFYTTKELADTFILKPMVADFLFNNVFLHKNGSFADADPAQLKAVLKAVRSLLTYELVVLSCFFVILMFAVPASVHSTFEAYTANVLSLKEMLLGTKRRWRRALTTSIWMIIIALASAALLLFMVGVVGAMAGLNSVESATNALSWTLIILGGGYAAYLCSLWMLGLVVSVIEEKASGLKAITQANELMKDRKLQNIGLMVIIVLAGWAISEAFDHLLAAASAATGTENAKLAMVVSLAISIPNNLAYCVLQLFAFVVYTVFYHDCKKGRAMEKNVALYSPVPTAVAE